MEKFLIGANFGARKRHSRSIFGLRDPLLLRDLPLASHLFCGIFRCGALFFFFFGAASASSAAPGFLLVFLFAAAALAFFAAAPASFVGAFSE